MESIPVTLSELQNHFSLNPVDYLFTFPVLWGVVIVALCLMIGFFLRKRPAIQLVLFSIGALLVFGPMISKVIDISLLVCRTYPHTAFDPASLVDYLACNKYEMISLLLCMCILALLIFRSSFRLGMAKGNAAIK